MITSIALHHYQGRNCSLVPLRGGGGRSVVGRAMEIESREPPRPIFRRGSHAKYYLQWDGGIATVKPKLPV
jgi:hypothetical protein